MNKTYVTLAILVLLVGGVFIGFRKNLEAPTVDNTNNTNTSNPDASARGYDVKKVEGTGAKTTLGVELDTPSVKEFTVTGQNFSFSPSVLTVKKGDKVKITFKNANGMHNLIIDEFNVGTKLIQGGTQETIEFTADKTGSFQYYCSVGSHRAQGMWGTLKVE